MKGIRKIRVNINVAVSGVKISKRKGKRVSLGGMGTARAQRRRGLCRHCEQLAASVLKEQQNSVQKERRYFGFLNPRAVAPLVHLSFGRGSRSCL